MDTPERQKLKTYKVEDVGGELMGYKPVNGSISYGNGCFRFYDNGEWLNFAAQPTSSILHINSDDKNAEAIKITQEGIEWRPVLSRII